MLARKIHHLRHFGLGDLIGEHAALADPVMMDVQHDLGGGLDILLEELLQHVNDEFHRRVIVVQNQDAVEMIIMMSILLYNHIEANLKKTGEI